MNLKTMKASILSGFEHFRATGKTDGITAYNALMPYRQEELLWSPDQKQKLIEIAKKGGYEKEMKKLGII